MKGTFFTRSEKADMRNELGMYIVLFSWYAM